MSGNPYCSHKMQKNIHVILFSGEPLSFENVFTAFGVGLLGLIISFGLLLIEMITSKYGRGGCKRLLNAYNYRSAEKYNTTTDKSSVPVFTARRRNQSGPL